MDSSMEPIAIVGMACRLPGDANSPSALWQLLVNGRSAHGQCPPSRFSEDGWVHNDFQKRSGYFLTDDIRAFDHEFFGILPAEAACMDPQQRQLLEVVYECFESAGVSLDQVSGSDTGCYVGNFTYDYPVMQSKDPESFQRYSATGMGAGILSNRISHAFNMTGPSLVIDTACSSSLYCLHTACNALHNSECHAAVVASANLIQSIEQYLGMEKAGVLSPSGKCQTFSHLADGYGRADAVCAVYIKTLKDAVRDNDPIRAVIIGSATGSNGKTLGLASPDVAAQQRVISQAYNRSSLKPADISYVECHGTGTAVGDPVEIEALSRVFQRDSTDRLLIGGLKPNIGHGEAASGLSSVIKVVLALEARKIPPTVIVQPINSSIKVAEWGVDIVTGVRDWFLPEEFSKSSAQVCRAGVNSFGYGGANAHVVLEEAAAWVNSSSDLKQSDNFRDNIIASDRKVFLLPFSASCMWSLRARVSQLAAINPRTFDLHSLAYTLGCRRTHFSIRGFLTLREDNFYENLNPELLQTLPSQEAQPPSRPLTFVFTGQGAQWPGMGKELFKEFASFRHAIRDMDCALKQLPHAPLWTLEDIILDTSSSSPIHNASYAQPVTTALQVALVALLASFNVYPAIVVGHSSGEISAAFAAGYISLKQAIYAAYYRGYVNALNERDGLMLAVGLSPSEVLSEIQRLSINDQVQVGCHNSPENVTVTGNATEVRNLSDTLQRRGVFARELQTGGKAYHSHHMLALGPRLEALLHGVPYSTTEMQIRAKNVQFFSTVTGEVKKDDFNESYWRHNMESPVLFSESVQQILQKDATHFIEIGPHSALELPLKQIASTMDHKQVIYSTALSRGKDGAICVLNLIGRLYLHWYPVSFNKLNLTDGFHARLIPDLPPYPWQHNKILWNEPRVSSGLRFRRRKSHVLLGATIPGGDGRTMQWRNKLSLDNIPWLQDHKLEETVVFPAAAYITIAVEAITQANGGAIETSQQVMLRNIRIHSALILPNSSVEVITTLHPKSASLNQTLGSWWNFEIVSYQEDGPTLHTTGSISIQAQSETHVKSLQINSPLRRLLTPACYRRLAQVGLNFGPEFQSLRDISVSRNRQAIAEIVHSSYIPKHRPTYMAHSIEIDALLQAGIVAHTKGLLEEMNGMVPVFIGSAVLWPIPVEKAETIKTIYASTNEATTSNVELNAELQDSSGKLYARLECAGMAPYTSALSSEQQIPRHAIARSIFAPLEMGILPALPEFIKDKSIIIIQADDAGYKMKLLQFLLQIQFSSQVLIYKLSDLEKSQLPPRSTVVSLVEAERPHLAVITENAMRQVKILTGNASRIIWVTSGGLLRCPNPDFALVAGLARTLMLEQPSLSFFNFDVPSEELCSLQTARNIISVLFQDIERLPEYEIIQDNRTLHASRFVLDKDANQSFSNALEGQTTFKNLKDASPARFSVSYTRNLIGPVFEASEILQSLEAGYVEVEVGTVGLNSQLFFSSDRQHDTTTPSHIMDFCGVVKRVASDIRTLSPGDRVVTMLPSDLRTHHVVPAWACKVLKDTDSFDIICTVPYTYSSVSYALKERAHLQAEERILIHQAESFVGQAAIRIAQLAGAEVFVTIPSQFEKEIFVKRYHLDASHIYNYSDKGFITAIAAATQDQGFDVILNLFSKEALCNIGRLCAPFGRFVHFNSPGRKSEAEAEELDTTAWNHNVTFITSSFVDIFRHPRQHIRQSVWSRLLSEVMDLYWEGSIFPQGKATTYSISDLEKASRDSMRMDPGNIAVSLVDPNSIVNLRSPTYNTVLDPSRIYILVGGLGGIGGSITKWMFSRGARRFVFVGRSDPAHSKNEALVASVQSMGAKVNVEQGDVTSFEDMKRIISAIDEPIGGVVHAAMGLSEAVFSNMSAKAWHTSIDPKLKGCWNLHKCLLETGNNSLDFLLVISSTFGSVGSIAQSNYCAANSALDTFARYRRSLGLPAVSVGLGIITDVGYLSENPEVEEKTLRSGISSLNEKEMLLVIDQALSADSSNSQFGTFSSCHFVTGLEYLSNPSLRPQGHQGLPYFAQDRRFSELITAQSHEKELLKEERKGILAEFDQLHQRGAPLDDPIIQHIKQGLCQILGLDADKIDLTKSLPNYGIDSMVATEIRMWLFRSLQVDISLFQILSKTMTIQMLASTVVELISERLG